MPWPAYRQLADQDLKAIFAYLRSLKPVKNIPPPPRALQDLP
jgi:mono/diheme cytochrome c family protein